MTHLAVRDPLRRLTEYQSALKRLVSQEAFNDIVFIENSNFLSRPEAQSFVEMFSSKVRFTSAKRPDIDPKLGKGLPEALMIVEALEDSIFQSDCLVTKISGRYKFENARAYTSSICNVGKKIYCQMLRELTYSDTRVLTFSPHFFRDYVVPNLGMIDDSVGFYIEHCVAKGVHDMISNEGGGWGLPPVRPWLKGVSGSTGRPSSGIIKKYTYDVGYRLLRYMTFR